MEIFKLVGSIMVDSAEAQNSISKTGKDAEGLSSKLASGVQTAGKWAAGIVAGATAVGAAMVAAAKDTAADLDVIDKASTRMGITAEAYQELAYAAELSGVSMGTMEKAAKKLEGTDLNLDDAIDQLMSIADENERAAAAAELFGNNVAYEMTPLLQAGAEGMQSMRDEANELGLVMSGEAVKSGAAMNDMFTKIDQSIATLKNSLLVELMPYVMEILQFLIDEIPKIKEVVQKVMSAIMPIVKPILESVMSLIKSVLSLINGDLEGFVTNFKNVFTNLGSAAVTLGKNIMQNFWNGLVEIWNGIIQWLGNAIQGLWNDLVGVGRKIANFFTGGNAHASGLAYVPYDNYPALLHRGETVLNANDSAELMDMVKNRDKEKTQPEVITIPVQVVLDGKVVGEASAKYNRDKARAYG